MPIFWRLRPCVQWRIATEFFHQQIFVVFSSETPARKRLSYPGSSVRACRQLRSFPAVITPHDSSRWSYKNRTFNNHFRGPTGNFDVALHYVPVVTAWTQSSVLSSQEVLRQSCCSLHRHKDVQCTQIEKRFVTLSENEVNNHAYIG